MRQDQRSCREPLFWLLFGAGGSLGALCGPALILILLLLPALGIQGDGAARFLSGPGRFFIFVFLSLSAWCGLHRIAHCLRDLKLRSAFAARCCYGGAALITALGFIGCIAG